MIAFLKRISFDWRKFFGDLLALFISIWLMVMAASYGLIINLDFGVGIAFGIFWVDFIRRFSLKPKPPSE